MAEVASDWLRRRHLQDSAVWGGRSLCQFSCMRKYIWEPPVQKQQQQDSDNETFTKSSSGPRTERSVIIAYCRWSGGDWLSDCLLTAAAAAFTYLTILSFIISRMEKKNGRACSPVPRISVLLVSIAFESVGQSVSQSISQLTSHPFIHQS